MSWRWKSAGTGIAVAIVATTLLAGAGGQGQAPQVRKSHVVIYTLASRATRTLVSVDGLLEAPNWSPDGKNLLVNMGGELYKIAVAGTDAKLEKIDLGGMSKCNNDKGYSPDGKLIAFSSSAQAKGSQVFTVSAAGGTPQRIVSETPSYFHGFSPDGKWMAFVAQRENNFDLYRVPTAGGKQERLTSNAGYDDGPDYSPDGRWIYFNSDRQQGWDIWRMPADGAGPNDAKAERVTSDDGEDWFPHLSPDGQWLLFLTFPNGTSGHNGRMQVKLRMRYLAGPEVMRKQSADVASFFGGQGSINVNSWSPDSRSFAYVTYEQ
jgi:TolB protein